MNWKKYIGRGLATFGLFGILVFNQACPKNKIEVSVYPEDVKEYSQTIEKEKLEKILTESGIEIIEKEYETDKEFDELWDYLINSYIPAYNKCLSSKFKKGMEQTGTSNNTIFDFEREDFTQCLQNDKYNELMNIIENIEGLHFNSLYGKIYMDNNGNYFEDHGKVYIHLPFIFDEDILNIITGNIILEGKNTFILDEEGCNEVIEKAREEGNIIYDSMTLSQEGIGIFDYDCSVDYKIIVLESTLNTVDKEFGVGNTYAFFDKNKKTAYFDVAAVLENAEIEKGYSNINPTLIYFMLKYPKIVYNEYNESKKNYNELNKIAKRKGISYEEVYIRNEVKEIIKIHEPLHRWVDDENFVDEMTTKISTKENKY